MSHVLRAGEQLLLIVGVVSLCCLLYLASALAESFCLGDRRKRRASDAWRSAAPKLGSAATEEEMEGRAKGDGGNKERRAREVCL